MHFPCCTINQSITISNATSFHEFELGASGSCSTGMFNPTLLAVRRIRSCSLKLWIGLYRSRSSCK